MSGVATETFKLSELIKDLPVKIADTRKTLPGWRVLDKYSVLIGGGMNHRMNLSDQILIKDNHLNNISLTDAVSICRQKFDSLKIEVEVENWDQLKEAMKNYNLSIRLYLTDKKMLSRENHLSLSDTYYNRAKLFKHRKEYTPAINDYLLSIKSNPLSQVIEVSKVS